MSRLTIVGGGLAGLLAAYRLVQEGHDVTLLEASESLGGMIASVDLAGVRVDAGAEAYATRGGVVRPLITELGLEPAGPSGDPHVWWPTGSFPLANGVLGIPASLADPAFGSLTPDELAIAARDLELGPEVGADATTVGELVAARMGQAVVDKLVAPLTTGVYGSDPAKLALFVSPGLLPALAEQGSLMGAVAAVRTPGSAAVEQPVGGMFRLSEQLARRIDELGASVVTGATVTTLERHGKGFAVTTADGRRFTSDRVVLAAPAAVSLRLVGQLGPQLEVPGVKAAHHTMLALTTPQLRDEPIGSGVLLGTRDPSVLAKAMTHYSAKWPWVREVATKGPAVEVLRISYPEHVFPTSEQVIADASALTGVDIATEDVAAMASLVWEAMPARISPETRDTLIAGAAEVGVELVGAWLDGNGMAAIVQGVARVLR